MKYQDDQGKKIISSIKYLNFYFLEFLNYTQNKNYGSNSQLNLTDTIWWR